MSGNRDMPIETSAPPFEQKWEKSFVFKGQNFSLRAQHYHRLYDDARAAYDQLRLCACRQKCLHLLEKAYLPRFTKCRTLQLLASCSYYYHAKKYLEDALQLCDEMEIVKPDASILKLRQSTLRMISENETDGPNDGESVAYRKELEYDESDEIQHESQEVEDSDQDQDIEMEDLGSYKQMPLFDDEGHLRLIRVHEKALTTNMSIFHWNRNNYTQSKNAVRTLITDCCLRPATKSPVADMFLTACLDYLDVRADPEFGDAELLPIIQKLRGRQVLDATALSLVMQYFDGWYEERVDQSSTVPDAIDAEYEEEDESPNIPLTSAALVNLTTDEKRKQPISSTETEKPRRPLGKKFRPRSLSIPDIPESGNEMQPYRSLDLAALAGAMYDLNKLRLQQKHKRNRHLLLLAKCAGKTFAEISRIQGYTADMSSEGRRL